MTLGTESMTLFDLGEFDQKERFVPNTVSKTIIFAIQAPQRCRDSTNGRCSVPNHKAAADGLEEFEVVEVDPMDRNKIPPNLSPFKDGPNYL